SSGSRRRDPTARRRRTRRTRSTKETPSRSEEAAASAPGSAGDALKNNIPEIAPNYSSEFVPRKNVTNAPSQADTLNGKIDSNSLPANPDTIATMCDENSTTVDATPPSVTYARQPDQPAAGMAERRGSCVKPCGHGTVAIAPYVPLIGSKRENAGTPPSSPVAELKRPFRISQLNAIQEKASPADADRDREEAVNGTKDDRNTVTASMKLHVNLPNGSAAKKPAENGVEKNEGTKNLINQEAKFQSQLNDLSKQLSVRDAEASKLRFQMEELQRDVFAKSAGMDRLQSELNAANKECETIRQRIRQLENELENYRTKHVQLTDQLSNKSELFSNYEKETTAKIEELEGTVKELREKIEDLEQQLASLQEEKDKLNERHAQLIVEREEEKKKVADTIEHAVKQKEEIEKKWKEDFEKLRTINILKEQQLLDDFEWKLREVQQTCKKRLEDKDKVVEEKLQEAYKEAEQKMKETEDLMEKVEDLKSYAIEVEQLRDITISQDRTLKVLLEQQEQMKSAEESLKSETKKLRTLIDMEKENLQHIQRVHHQDLLDKERNLRQVLDEKRTEIAMYWEERLLHECGRLKTELEQIHNEEKWMAMESVRKRKDEDFQKAQKEWEQKLRDCMKEVGQLIVASLKKSLVQKDEYYREEIVRQQTTTDRDIMELRRLMDKIDMSHHNKYEKVLLEHETELEKINEEHEKKLKEVENCWHEEVNLLRSTLETVKEQMEKESQQKIEMLIQQHRNELGEAIQLLEEEYVTKYKTLEEQFYTQQKSHSLREIELLKTIDSLKNELESKESTIDDLQNNIDTLEGGVQVLNQEIFQQGEDIVKSRREADQKIRGLQDAIAKLQAEQEKEREAYRLKYMSSQKQAQESIDHLQRKCTCLTKLFEEVRQRYERRESRQEDLNTISDLKQVIAEQEKDLACINEEKRYFQMRLMALEKHLDENASAEEEEFEDAHALPIKHENTLQEPLPPDFCSGTSGPPSNPQSAPISIPPTILECDE
ncbi:hypothetical protein NQ318_021501, partial [Aromia moschata]